MDQCKTCARCKEPKPVCDFATGKRWSDGLFPYCRECKRASDRAYHARNRAARNNATRAAYRRNSAPYKVRALARYAVDPALVKQRAALWSAANPERRRAIRAASQRRRHALDPERKREVWRRRHAAIKRGCAVYRFTTDQVAAKVAFWAWRCWICRNPYEAIDHVKPLAKGGPHMLANLRPICTACNTRKRDLWPFP